MCFPIPMVGAIISAVGSLASGAMQAQSYNAQAAYQERQAKMEKQKGAYEAARTRDSNDRRLAQMRGNYMSSGVALEGSPLEVLQDSASEASLDEQAIRYGSTIRSDNYQFEAGMSRLSAGSAMFGGFMGAASGLVGGLTQARQSGSGFSLNRRSFEADRTMIRNPYAGGY